MSCLPTTARGSKQRCAGKGNGELDKKDLQAALRQVRTNRPAVEALMKQIETK
jgi:hypothetical protein